jgi:hypothetical protein
MYEELASEDVRRRFPNCHVESEKWLALSLIAVTIELSGELFKNSELSREREAAAATRVARTVV